MLPNTTTNSKQVRTHTWGYAILPPNWLYTAYTIAVVPIVIPPFRNSQPGSHGAHSSPFSTTVLVFVLISREKTHVQNQASFHGPRLRRTGVHSCNLPVYSAVRRLRGAFCSHFVCSCFCFRLRSRPERTHTSRFLILFLVVYIYMYVVSYRYHAIYGMISVSRHTEHIVDVKIDISRTYRMIYLEFCIRYRTLQNRKRIRTRIRGYASLPPS